MRASPPPRLFARDVREVHFVGVGGTGMAPLALYLRQSGLRVSGEDDALAPAVRALLEPGGVVIPGGRRARDLRVGRLFIGHRAGPPGPGARRRARPAGGAPRRAAG